MDDKDIIQQNPLDILKSIGSEKISEQTHIDERIIKCILDQRLDKLADVNVKGFIKIIQREFGVDITPILFPKNQPNVEKRRRIPKNSDQNTQATPRRPQIQRDYNRIQKPLPNLNEPRKPKILSWIILIGILGGFVYYFKLYEIFNFFSEVTNDKEANYSNISIVSQAEKKLESMGVDTPKFDENKTLIQESNLTSNEKNSENNTTELNNSVANNEIEIKEESNPNTEKNQESNEEKSEQVDLSNIKLKNNEIAPREKMWLGSIELKTGRKVTRSITEPFELDVKKDQLILTGHGYFKININGKVETFDTKTPIRFYIKNGKITKIDYDEFVKLNKGKAW